MTDEELKKAAEEYAGLYFDRQTEYKSFWHDVDTFKAVAEWMKKQIMEEAVEGWVARDKNGRITLYEDKPYRDGDIWRGCSWKSSLIYDRFFPNLKWEDEPIKVRIIIVKEEN